MPWNSKTAAEAGRIGVKGKHQKTKQWEALSGSIVTTHAERFNQVLADADDDKFGVLFLQVLNYFKPKYQSTTIDAHIAGLDKIDVKGKRPDNK